MQKLLVICVLFAWTATAFAQPADDFGAGTDLPLGAELTLENQLIRISYRPDLTAEAGTEPRRVLAGVAGARVSVGVLEGHRALRLGEIVPDFEPPPVSEEISDPDAADDGDEDESSGEPRYELVLVRAAAGWELEASGGNQSAEVYRIPLRHEMVDRSVAALSIALRATAGETGRLAFRWGRHRWSSEFRFDELPPPPRRPRVSGRGSAREGDSDPAEVERSRQIARGLLLGERNESALVRAGDDRIAIAFWKGLDVEDDDYLRLSTVMDGEVIELVRASVLRFKTDVSLRFGETVVPTGNLAAGFAGAYGLWLKRVGDGWRFVFNDEADSWGTQYDPEYDAAEIPVGYSRTGGAFRPLGATIVANGANEGRLVVHWGLHEWAADFTVAE